MTHRFREPVNGLTHLVAGLIALGGLVALLFVGRGNTPRQVSLLVYGVSLMLMFFASAAYHLVKARPEVVKVLRKLDHSAIYLLIAGTYTPICFNMFTGFWRDGMLAIIWSIALVGIIFKIFIINAPRWLNAGLYLLMGWLSLLTIGQMLAHLPVGALIWLLAGGVFFTLGAVIYITKILDFVPGVFGFHEVWHIFVILGALSHFIVILIYVAPAPGYF
jgi:hemolysin III